MEDKKPYRLYIIEAGGLKKLYNRRGTAQLTYDTLAEARDAVKFERNLYSDYEWYKKMFTDNDILIQHYVKNYEVENYLILKDK